MSDSTCLSTLVHTYQIREIRIEPYDPQRTDLEDPHFLCVTFTDGTQSQPWKGTRRGCQLELDLIRAKICSKGHKVYSYFDSRTIIIDHVQFAHRTPEHKRSASSSYRDTITVIFNNEDESELWEVTEEDCQNHLRKILSWIKSEEYEERLEEYLKWHETITADHIREAYITPEDEHKTDPTDRCTLTKIFTRGGTLDVLNPSIQGAMSDLRSIRTGGSPEGDTYYIILH